MNKNIMPYFNNNIHVVGSILWSPLKNRTPQNFTIANLGTQFPNSDEDPACSHVGKVELYRQPNVFWNLEFLIIITFSAMYSLNRD